MSDQLKRQILIHDDSNGKKQAVIDAVRRAGPDDDNDRVQMYAEFGWANREMDKRCDNCCEPLTPGFMGYDYLVLRDSPGETDDEQATAPRRLCRDCYNCRDDRPKGQPRAGYAWLVRCSPVMTCPKCKGEFANRYARKHRHGLPACGVAGEIVCHTCDHLQDDSKGYNGFCKWCDGDFDKVRSDAKFCSAKCRVAANRAARKVNADDTTD
jgi:hypothetical protein